MLDGSVAVLSDTPKPCYRYGMSGAKEIEERHMQRFSKFTQMSTSHL